MTEKVKKPDLLVLLGPTAVGKTRLSIEIAKQWNCEIISGDSMQIYRGMDIGTAKISTEEMAGVPHHMLNIHDPDYPFSVAEFQDRVKRLIEDIHARGRLPFIVGGTGLYIESVCYNFQFNEMQQDPDYREQLRQFAAQEGEQALHDLLQREDPQSAERLHPNDVKRIIRALEIKQFTGIPMSAQQEDDRSKESPYNLCMIGLTMERDLLYERIEQRIDLMMKNGLADEVHNLLNTGYNEHMVSMQALGYKEIIGYLHGEYHLEDAIALLKRVTRRFAKRQLSW
ncbi:MAG: tRNA (adenosine(37)-N6)-dimethylallyltransferase MiaA, partial [Paenibacillus sp. RIFOXYA1_FULL_44_5]